MMVQTFFFLFTLCVSITSQESVDDIKIGWTVRYPCEENKNITFNSEYGQSLNGDFQFYLTFDFKLEKNTVINATFASPANIDANSVIELFINRNDKLNIHVLKPQEKLEVRLKTFYGVIPEVKSILINNKEQCRNYVAVGTEGPSNEVQVQEVTTRAPKPLPLSNPQQYNCGIRKVNNVELILGGEDTKLGDWPWHVALYDLKDATVKYICGGTLISKTLVLTAAHCVTLNGVAVRPGSLKVSAGKYNLLGGEETPQERLVYDVTSHPNYEPVLHKNDIALLTLRSQVVFNNYVQPACIWESKFLAHLPSKTITGTIAGWGLDNTYAPSEVLRQATFPRIPTLKCIKNNPTFFAEVLNDNNFCAGFTNGTAACNGDSGGGFHVFVPDTPADISDNAPGRWYVQGVISQAVSQTSSGHKYCDPNYYVVFTDVEPYLDWIQDKLSYNMK